MPEPSPPKPIDLGVYGRTARGGFGLAEAAAVGLGLVWTAAVLAYAAFPPADGDPPGLLLTAAAILLPLALIGMALAMLRAIRVMRDEAARLQAAVDAMRQAYVAQQQAAAAGLRTGPDPAAARPAEPALPRRSPAMPERRQALAPPAPPADDQPGLALDTPADALSPPISTADFIAALNFPESETDTEGFRTLRLALEDRGTAKLIRSAQDVLTLLSQDGIYMDDLLPEPARPDAWRGFARGERGRAVAGLGGIRDPESLTLTAARMREDPVFRDAAHHFLRQFDRIFQEFERNASDADLADLAQTRTARAFMLCGRVAGSFD